ncbi:reverse transcriptase [Tanacetum coccineum]
MGADAELLMFYVYPNTRVQLMNAEGKAEAEAFSVLELEKVVETFEDVYPPMQKDVIEVMVKELLDSGVIKPSNSPFSSPIVMVKKKDNTWRMCVDYCQLNKNTIKDKFLIPIIKDLIEELHGATMLMNENKLVAKKSKCVFGTNHVEYLGHVIFAKGVATKTSKISVMKRVKQFVRECLVCQKYKPDLEAYPGFLQPLPIPQTIWTSISMNFIKGLTKSQGKNVIFMVVDMFSKYAHFIPLTHPFTANQVAQVFLDNVYKLHGMPESIVCDKDKIFLSTFWRELFKLVQVKLLMSTSYHPQTDGQTKVVNRILEGYMRCMTGEHIKEWARWLSLAELWGEVPAALQILMLQCDQNGQLAAQPMALLDRKMVKKKNTVVVYGLIQWTNGSREEAT